MSTSLRPIGLNKTVDDELNAMTNSIDMHQKTLQEEGIWLFLAVLGCWSVHPEPLRICALCLALFLFGQRYETHRTDQRNFAQQFVSARSRMSALSVDAESKREGFERLARLESEKLGGFQPLYKAPGFAIGWVALVATLLATAHAIWRHAGAA